MLQFIAQENDKYSLAEQMQMAIEGGCQWIQLRVPGMSDEQIRELAREVIPLCRETSTILVMEDHVELVKELAIHGVHITPEAGMSAAGAREFLGPEAIVGVQVGLASSVVALRNADIDYAAFTPGMKASELRIQAEAVHAAGVEIPLVASGDYPVDHIAEIMASGMNGIALAATIGESHDPVAATSEILDILKA